MSHSNQSFSQPKSWDLSLYELHRTPQETITDDTKIAISPRSLHSELMCPICLDMLTGTMTTKECLHRFCHDCITTALRNGNKECPTCRKKLISKRSLRKDPNFDSLIQKIYPDRDEYEAHQEKVMEKLNQHTNQQALTNSIEEGLRLQAQNRLQRMLKQQQKRAAEAAAQEAAAQEAAAQEAAETATTNSQGESRQVNHSTNDPTTDESIGNKSIKIEVSCVDSTSLTTVSSPSTTKASSSTSLGKRKRKESVDSDQSSQSYLENPEHVELIFYPHPNSPSCYVDQQQLRYIKTTTNASVEHLTKYLSLRLMIDTKSNEETNSNEKRHDDTFDLYLQHIEEYDKLEGNLTLLQIQNTYWKENRPIELFFLPKVNPNE